jgi:hypothetical protein
LKVEQQAGEGAAGCAVGKKVKKLVMGTEKYRNTQEYRKNSEIPMPKSGKKNTDFTEPKS